MNNPISARKFKDAECEHCGKSFTPTSPNARHCCPECQSLAYKERQRGVQADRRNHKDKHYSTAGEIHQLYKNFKDKQAVAKYYYAFCDMTDREQRIILRLVDNIIFVSPRLSAISALEIVAQLGNWLNMVDARAK